MKPLKTSFIVILVDILVSNLFAKIFCVGSSSDVSEPSQEKVVLVALQVELENHHYHVGLLFDLRPNFIFFRLRQF